MIKRNVLLTLKIQGLFKICAIQFSVPFLHAFSFYLSALTTFLFQSQKSCNYEFLKEKVNWSSMNQQNLLQPQIPSSGNEKKKKK